MKFVVLVVFLEDVSCLHLSNCEWNHWCNCCLIGYVLVCVSGYSKALWMYIHEDASCLFLLDLFDGRCVGSTWDV